MLCTVRHLNDMMDATKVEAKKSILYIGYRGCKVVAFKIVLGCTLEIDSLFFFSKGCRWTRGSPLLPERSEGG